MWKQTINLHPPYDYHQVLARLSLDPLNNVDKNSVKVPIYATGNVALVEFAGSMDGPVAIISSESDVMNELNRIFLWDKSLTEIHEHFLKTSLKELFEKQKGTPFFCDFSLYASLMKCIIHQQLNLKFAYTLTERFVHHFGEKVDGVWFYPKPEKVAELSYDKLRELQFSQRKAEYIIDTSKMIAAGELDLTALQNMPDEEIMEQLVKIRGVGPWTVQNVLMFGLGRPNLLPSADIGIQNALKKYFGLDKKPTKEEIEKMSEDWDPYKTYASFYLWRSIE